MICYNLWLQGRSDLKGRTRGGRYLRWYRWVRRTVWWWSCPFSLCWVCAKPLCTHMWPTSRPAVFIRHPAADPDHSSASGRPLRGNNCEGRIELIAATSREKVWGKPTLTVQQSLPELRDLIVLIEGNRDAAWVVVNSLTPTLFGQHDTAHLLRIGLWSVQCNVWIVDQ